MKNVHTLCCLLQLNTLIRNPQRTLIHYSASRPFNTSPDACEESFMWPFICFCFFKKCFSVVLMAHLSRVFANFPHWDASLFILYYFHSIQYAISPVYAHKEKLLPTVGPLRVWVCQSQFFSAPRSSFICSFVHFMWSHVIKIN